MIDRIILYLKGLGERRILVFLLAMTFGLRLYAVLMAQGIANDSASYGFMARDFFRGDFLKGLSPAFHPLYPYLISLFSPSAPSVEIVGRLTSLFFGTFTLIPVYYLAKKAMGQREAVLAGLFYCFHPYLVTYSGMLLSEATYWGLLTLSIYFFWSALKNGGLYPSLISGALLGLSYLTRPEGMGYLAVFLVWAVFYGGVKKNGLRKAILAAGLVVAFLVPSVPYLVSIHQETGQWLISKKARKVQPWAETRSEPRGDPGPLKANAAERDKPAVNAFNVRHALGTFVRNLPFSFYHYLRAFHFTLWVFLIFGLIRMWRQNAEIRWFLGSLVLFHFVSLAAFTSSSIRFSVPLIPISLLWAGAGVLEIQKFLERVNLRKSEKWLFCLVGLLLVAQLPSAFIPERWHRRDQKKVGTWLRQNTTEGSVIMSNSPQEAFYANRPFVQLPHENPGYGNNGASDRDIILFAKENRVRYILIDRYTREFNAPLVDSVSSCQDLKEFYRYRDSNGYITAVYELLY